MHRSHQTAHYVFKPSQGAGTRTPSSARFEDSSVRQADFPLVLEMKANDFL